jgi:hypothetical protein
LKILAWPLGPPFASITSVAVSQRGSRIVTSLQTSDEPLLITASGLGQLGGFSLLRVRQIYLLGVLLLTPVQRVMPTRVKKKMPTIAGRKGIWSMRINQETRTGSKSSTKSAPPLLDDNLLFSTDATPAIASRVCMQLFHSCKLTCLPDCQQVPSEVGRQYYNSFVYVDCRMCSIFR